MTNGTTAQNLTYVIPIENAVSNPLFYAILSTVFAYAGSEEVLMMSSEIKNREKNLPRAIIIGSLIIIAIYVGYTVGIFGAIDAAAISTPGGVTAAFQNIFGPAFGSILTVFVIISCLGAMNSGYMAGSRAFYALAIRGRGPNPSYVKEVDAKTNMPATSAAISLLFCGIIFFVVFANAQDMASYPYIYHRRWFGDINLAVSSLAPITLMAFYIPVFVAVMIKKTQWNVFNRFIMPALSIAGALTLIYMVFYTNRVGAMWYLGGFAIFMLVAAIFLAFNKKNELFQASETISKEVA